MKKKVAAILAAAAVFVSAMPLSAAAADTPAPYVESDTTMNFLVEQGKTYTFKMTVHGTHANPNIVMGNGAAFQTREVRKVTENGNDVYYFKVLATGEEGQAAGIYTTLPGQPSVKHAVAAIPYVSTEVGPYDNLNINYTKSYQIGKDIPAGEYVIFPYDTYHIAWAVVTGPNGEDETSRWTHGKDGRAYLTVQDGQTLRLSMAKAVAIQNAVRALPNEEGQMGIGSSNFAVQYKCGFDIAPGTYTVVRDPTYYGEEIGMSSATVYRSSDGYHRLDNQISSEEFWTGTRQITIEDGEYLELCLAYLQLP